MSKNDDFDPALHDDPTGEDPKPAEPAKRDLDPGSTKPAGREEDLDPGSSKPAGRLEDLDGGG